MLNKGQNKMELHQFNVYHGCPNSRLIKYVLVTCCIVSTVTTAIAAISQVSCEYIIQTTR